MTRLINDAGLTLVKEYEGFRAVAYEDTSNIWTLGYGHTSSVREGDTCTQAEAEVWLEADLGAAEAAVSRLVTVPLTDNQFSALVSFVFNEGQGQFEKSTLLQKLNAGDYASVPSELDRWIFDAGKIQQGLERRRAAEAALWSRA